MALVNMDGGGGRRRYLGEDADPSGGFDQGGANNPPPTFPTPEPRSPDVYPDPTPSPSPTYPPPNDFPSPTPPRNDTPAPTPTPTPTPATPNRADAGAPTPSAPSATAAYLKSLLDSGLSPQEAVARFNRDTGRSYGNEAVYYGNNNTIGLPEGYFAGGAGGWVWNARGAEGGGSASQGYPSPAAVSGNTPVFSDPATKEWEAALRGLVDRLNQPINLPDYQPMVEQMRSYIQRLQQPAYTPNQMDLIQTQSLDPLERQRQATHQQILNRLASRGIDPRSGIAEQAFRDADRQFDEIRTKTQAGFATNAINLDRQNAQLANDLAAQLTSIEAGMHSANMNQAQQAVNALFQLPQFANTRLQLGLQTLGAGQPNMNLYPSLQGFQQQGIQQQGSDAQYWAQIGAMIARLIAGG